MTIAVTGGAGFIGSNFILDWFENSSEHVLNIDNLSYAGNPDNLAALASQPNYTFLHCGIEDGDSILATLKTHQVRAVVNFAAESHVDRSIASPEPFIQTNVVGTLRLLEAARTYWTSLPQSERDAFRFLHISTDEVFGTLAPDEPPFSESHQIAPNSPYAASKASSDHLVRAYGETYGLPVITTNCSNNYGPLQFPEKLIPLIIHNAIHGQPLPIYGDGRQVRDWLYVKDHCRALGQVLKAGRPFACYNIGGNNEKPNIDVVHTICGILDELRPRADAKPYAEQITFVTDRLGHDRRYAVDDRKIRAELGWQPDETFETGIRKTIGWYLANPAWVARVTSGAYRDWIKEQYG